MQDVLLARQSSHQPWPKQACVASSRENTHSLAWIVVPRALFPDFGAQEKRPGDDVDPISDQNRQSLYPFSDQNDAKPYPFGRHMPIWLIQGKTPPPRNYFTPFLHNVSLFELGLIDCANIIFSIIRHYWHNFHLFSRKSTASIIWSFGLWAAYGKRETYKAKGWSGIA